VSSTRPASVPSEQAHAGTLNDLDSGRLSLAKSISDTETMVVNREAELAALKDEARRLELYDPANEHEKELDGSAYVSGHSIFNSPDLYARFSDYDSRFTKGSVLTPSLIKMGTSRKCSFVRLKILFQCFTDKVLISSRRVTIGGYPYCGPHHQHERS